MTDRSIAAPEYWKIPEPEPDKISELEPREPIHD